MITFLITPVKSKRDSLLVETPACKLTFDVAETPVLFDSLSVNQLKKLQSLNESISSNNNNNKRDSICNLSLCGELPFMNDRRLSINTNSNNNDNNNNNDNDSPSPCFKLFDDKDGLTPANIFNQTLTKICDDLFVDDDETDNDNYDDCDDDDDDRNGFKLKRLQVNEQKDEEELEEEEQEEDCLIIKSDEENDIVTSIQYNNQFCITMLITKKKLSQQNIYQYLIDNNDINVNPRNINIIKSCDCIPCKHRNWNVVDIRWEKEWQTQQFIFNTDIDDDNNNHNDEENIDDDNNKYQQINDVNCENITNILLTNGILQKEIWNDAEKTFYRKMGGPQIAPNSNQQIIRKKRKRSLSSSLPNDNDNKAKDKKIILQHLATWSNCDIFQREQKIRNECNLPLVCKEDNGCSYISCQTLMELMRGNKKDFNLDYFVIIDCRYDYEYLGGHINGAINVSDKLLIQLLLKANMNLNNINSQKIGWIFHCEYSKHRGPQTCKYFRKLDRELNEHRYPYVSYPHVYVLQGGYKKFWYQYKDSYFALKNKIFSPFGYISMWNEVFDDKRFIYSQFRKNVWKKHKKKNHTKLMPRNHFF